MDNRQNKIKDELMKSKGLSCSLYICQFEGMEDLLFYYHQNLALLLTESPEILRLVLRCVLGKEPLLRFDVIPNSMFFSDS